MMKVESVLCFVVAEGYTLKEDDEEEDKYVLVREFDGKPIAKVRLEVEILEDQYEATA